MLSALFMVLGCKEAKEATKPVDKISITPKSKTFEKEGGSVPVIVTSSGEWTLTPADTYDWVTPSAVKGVDGDAVTFKVNENRTGAKLDAEFTFACGEASEKFKISVNYGKFSFIELPDGNEYSTRFDASEFAIDVNTNIGYDELQVNVSSEEGQTWATHKQNAPGTSQNTVTVRIGLEKNEGFESRNVNVTLSGSDSDPVTFTLTQLPETVLDTDKDSYQIGLEGGEVAIAMTNNVEYEVIIAEDAKSWISHTGKDGANEKFSVTASDASRDGSITFKEKNPFGGNEPLSVTVMINQKASALIYKAIDMTEARLFSEKWNNKDVLNGLKTFTLEALICADDFNKNYDECSTIMGIEGKFMVKFGDPEDRWSQNKLFVTDGLYTLVSDKEFEAGKWYHIAVTFNNSVFKAYADGELLGEEEGYKSSIDFGISIADLDQYNNQCFWIGYAWNEGRDFHGKMSEIRIWNRELTVDELKAENHFYQVDPNSEGLVAYWKLNDGDGHEGVMTVKDYTANGNDLIGEIRVHRDGDKIVGVPGIQWVDVSLPEAK